MLLRIIACSLMFAFPTMADAFEEEDTQSLEDERRDTYINKATDDKASSINNKNLANKWINLFGKFIFVSDYVNRGQTQTFGLPAVQGGLYLAQKEDEGLYAGFAGSNISDTIATNGSGMELDLFVGYKYKRDNDLSFELQMLNTRYPGAYANLPTKDSFDTLEIVPSVSYKIFYATVFYALSNKSGVSENFAPLFYVPLKGNGNSKGSCYVEAGINTPISFISQNLHWKISVSYQYVRNYTSLNYSVYGTGIDYQVPDEWGGVSLFANASATTANAKYYKLVDSGGKVINSVAPRIWVGISKKI